MPVSYINIFANSYQSFIDQIDELDIKQRSGAKLYYVWLDIPFATLSEQEIAAIGNILLGRNPVKVFMHDTTAEAFKYIFTPLVSSRGTQLQKIDMFTPKTELREREREHHSSAPKPQVTRFMVNKL